MSDKGTKALQTANDNRISILVWKLHKAIENAKEQDIPFTEVDGISKLAADSFKFFLEHGVLDENAHLHKPKHGSPRSHSASQDRRQNVRTTPGSEFCDDVKVTLNFEDDQTHDSIQWNPWKQREFEEKYKEMNLKNVRLGQELDRVKTCIAELEYQNKYLTCQVELAGKEMLNASRKDEKKYKHLESEVNKYKAEINLHRASNNRIRNAKRYRSERDLARCEIKDLKIELEKLQRTEIDLKCVKDESIALQHANESKTKMINKIQSRYEIEMTRNKETVYRLQSDLYRLKSQEDLQKQMSRGELDSLKEQRVKLERDKGILRTKIYSFDNEKNGLEERIEKAELILVNQQTLTEENSYLKESLETMKKEMGNMKKRYKKETAIRISTDGTTTKLKAEYDRLRKERNKAKYHVARITKEKEELEHELQHEIDAAKVKHDTLKKRKNELTSIFQEKAKRYQEKIHQLEKECETLVASFCRISAQDETDEQGPSASSSTATVIKRPEAKILPKLYRLLRENDKIENGLVAKDPNGHLYRLLSDDDILTYGLVAKNPDDRQISVAEHVANGSHDGKSRYISTCSSLGAAKNLRRLKSQSPRFRSGRKDIAEIDVAKLPMEVEIIDLRTPIDREKYVLQNRMEINKKFHKFASAHSEVLLVGRVPPECLTLT